MIEIERKFLVKSQAFKDEAFKKTHIKQGFLSTDKERTVRVRLKGEKGFLTIKGASSNDGLSRFEWEKEITKEDAEQLFKLCKKGIIDNVDDALAEQQRRQGQHRWLKQESRQQPTSIGTDSRRSCLYLPDERAQGLEGQMATSDRRTQRCEPSGDCTGQQECKNGLGDGDPGN